MARYKDLTTLDVATAKTYMRVTHTAEDSLVTIALNAAINRVDMYLDIDTYTVIADVPAEADLATLRLVEDWFKTRRDQTNESGSGYSATFGPGAHDIVRMLMPYRKNPLF